MEKLLFNNFEIENDNVTYWDSYYAGTEISLEESSFCKFTKRFVSKNSLIIDIGCGSGRDSQSFAKSGFKVIGLDRSKEAIKKNLLSIKAIKEKFCLDIEFIQLDLKESVVIEELLKELFVDNNKKNIVIYLRFLLHSIDKNTEEELFSILSTHLPSGSLIAAEFRTIEDKGKSKIYDNHYRRFIKAEDLMNDLKSQYGFEELYFTKGTGLSVYKDEDPFLARIIARKL
ncbi:class I SAM-dependent methyltransferase [Aciduricibacillus chroicocephali]|uniref:Class I SAM-dependent methyltransferase n=1 Tax=Aciduricibacillus chroicocephali TaxID=3054939 RepID=A0ABY9KWU8_9BACI|nr:class I SAM-dependent methyltransferase [Bacillaceae bacterium 44XB]